MNRMKSAALLLAGASTLVFPAFAFAQSAEEGVVVTGSRVIRNGNNSPTPVTVIGAEDVLRVVPTTISEALNTLPTFSGSRGAFSNPNSGTTVQVGGGNTSGSYLNLRNLGSIRTLILFDGNRVPPTSVNGDVDTDMIPQQLLQRVDVVTGGASAVYGSDAVSGVVNFITDANFNGVKANVQYGVTELGDDTSYTAGVAAGTDILDGRGHMEFSYDYRNDNGVGRRSSRDEDFKAYSIQGAGTNAAPFYLVPYARIASSSFGGLIVTQANGSNSALTGQTFKANGILSPFIHGTAAGTTGGTNEIGGDGYYFDTSLKSPSRSGQVFGRFDYDLTDKIHAFAEVAGNKKESQAVTTWINFNNLVFSARNGFLPLTYQNQLINASPSQTTFRMSKQLSDAPRNEANNRQRQVYLNSGIDGEFGDSYKWNIGYVHSVAKLSQARSAVDNGRLYAALDAVVNPANGQVVCSVTLTNPGLFPGCVPLNPFGPTSDDPAAVNYFMTTADFTATTGMDDLSGSLSGSPFATWAGPVTLAVSGEWRKVSYELESNAHAADLVNCTGLRFNCTATTGRLNQSTEDRSEVTQTVKEGAVEIDLPLLKDVPLADSFNLNGAARFTSYDTSGDYWTWKVGMDWHVIDAVRVRATRSRDIRAPTLDDLFSPTSIGTGGNFQDRLTGATASNVTTIAGGNPELTAEQGDTWTAGVVFRPSFVPGFSLAVDYFDIKVTNAILPLLASNLTVQTACNDSGGTSPYCDLFVRPFAYTNTTPANNVTTVYNRSVNIAEQQTNGADIETNYSTTLFGRPASARLLTTWQPHIKYIQPTVPTLDQAGAAFGNSGIQSAPIWRNTLFLRFSPIAKVGVDLQTRWRTSLKFHGDPTRIFSTPDIPGAAFTNLRVSYEVMGGKGTAFVNVSNLFDKAPPPAASSNASAPGQQTAFVTYDDPLGRAFTIGLRARF